MERKSHQVGLQESPPKVRKVDPIVALFEQCMKRPLLPPKLHPNTSMPNDYEKVSREKENAPSLSPQKEPTTKPKVALPPKVPKHPSHAQVDRLLRTKEAPTVPSTPPPTTSKPSTSTSTPPIASYDTYDPKPGSFILVSDIPNEITQMEELDLKDVPLVKAPERKVHPFCISVAYDERTDSFVIKRLENERKTIRNRLVQILYEEAHHLVARVAKVKIQGPFEQRMDGHERFITKLRIMCMEGFELAGEDGNPSRTFKFFGSSNSGQQSASWFAFEEKENDQLNKCGTLLNRYIADFSHASKQGIKKLLSRQGLCLGTSIATIKVKDSEIAQTPDEHFEDYCTTDGAGVCVLSCLREAAIEFNNQMGREVLSVAPTAMQIRLKSYKGVIFGYPEHHPLIKHLRDQYGQEKKYFLRESMWKIKAIDRYEYMDVLNLAKSMPFYYSRATLPILEYLGIPNQIFVDMAVKQLDAILRLSTDMRDFERVMNASDDSDSQYNGFSKSESLRRLYLVLQNEMLNIPFVREAVNKIILTNLEKYFNKYKLYDKKGQYLIGGFDDTGILKEGEVYVSFSLHKEPVILDNYRVLITRHPSVFPGDLRILKAVYVKELAHLRDCIIFPKGQFRPHQDMMAGGDCDGDLYSVVYNPVIVNNMREVEPEDYRMPVTAPPTPVTGTPEQIRRQLVDCIIDSRVNDETGRLGNMILAEVENLGGVTAFNYRRFAKAYTLALEGKKNSGLGERLKYKHPKEQPWIEISKALNRVSIYDQRVVSFFRMQDREPKEGGCTLMLLLFKEGKKRYIEALTNIEESKAFGVHDPLMDIINKYSNHPSFRHERVMAAKMARIWKKFFMDTLSTISRGQVGQPVSLHKKYLSNLLQEKIETDQQQFVYTVQRIFSKGWPQQGVTDPRFDEIKLEGYPDTSENLMVRTAAWLQQGGDCAFPFTLIDYICQALAGIDKGYQTKGGRNILAPVTCEKMASTAAMKRRM